MTPHIFTMMLLLHVAGAIPLAGPWQFALDPQGAAIPQQQSEKPSLNDSITLPTTTDVAGKGPETAPSQNTWALTRRHPYEGLAWYERTVTIPAEWSEQKVALYIERTKKIAVYLDDQAAIDGGSNLSTSHLVHLGILTPGEHRIALCVDNHRAVWPDRIPASHMLEEATQTNWNGVLGKIELQTEEQYGIQGICASAVGGNPHALGVRAYLDHAVGNPEIRCSVTQNGRVVGTGTAHGESLVIDVAKDTSLWDEFHPNLCQLSVTVTAPGFQSRWEGLVGLRDFRGRDGHLYVNGNRTFLRGKHDACVFPLTGHPPMDEAGWTHYFHVIKAYGLNHVRFHSWCPPEAAFLAADRLGVYLQPELPFWGDPAQPGVEPFLTNEGEQILKEYGHHPSFVMLSLGNEYWGASAPRPRMVAALHGLDPTRMFDQGSNTEWWNPQEFQGDDYRVAAFAKTGEDGKLRGSYAVDKDRGVGYIQTHVPGTMHTYSVGLAGKKLPFISHEVGQYQVFPNFAETAKYTGALRADNFAIFKDRLAKTGMLDQAEDFRQASGHLAAQCYREEIEAALRTPEMDGFQLLDLQDYPGQGTALVGMLDAFMDSKGLITETEWRSFCSDFVPLALFPKYTWRTDETFHAELRASNYRPDAVDAPVHWVLKQGTRILAQQSEGTQTVAAGGVTTVGTISCPLSSVSAPGRVELSVSVGGRTSTWPLWVYPATLKPVSPDAAIVRKLDAPTFSRLADGASLLYIPSADDLPNSLPGYFTPDFWCYPMFKGGNPPGTIGLLIQDKHPALAQFPTRSYSEWQWQDLAHHSRAVILDNLPGYRPIVQPIDNFDRNHRLGTLFELKVGKGRLLVCAIDLLDPSIQKSPEAQQLMTSLMDYIGSPQFLPTTEVTPEALVGLLGTPNPNGAVNQASISVPGT